MSRIRPFALSVPPIAVLLALALSALTASVLLLSARADTSPPLPCAVANQNGCTELSAIPPQNNVMVPPNIVLMLDDSGSMAWDFMPDWSFLKYQTAEAARDPLNNTLYYDASYVGTDKNHPGYQPPPRADSTPDAPDLYPNSPGITAAYIDGFAAKLTKTDVTQYSGQGNTIDVGHSFPYYTNVTTGTTPAKPPYEPVVGCPSNYKLDGTICVVIDPNPPTRAAGLVCPAGYSNVSGVCRDGEITAPPAYYQCPSGYSPTGHLSVPTTCTGPTPSPTKPTQLTCPEGGSLKGTPPMCVFSPGTSTIRVFTFVKDPGVIVPPNPNPQPTNPAGNALAKYTYYVAAGTPTNNCGMLTDATQKAHCVDADDTSGVAAPPGVPAGQNIANWFSYYRTRILFTKTGVMMAFSGVKPSYRFGFGSINANGAANIPGAPGGPAGPSAYSFDNLMSDGLGGSATNQIAVVQPFGNGAKGTQKALFWDWIANEPTSTKTNQFPQTPLRLSLNAVGQYYMTAQPWTTMSSDPGWTSGSTTQYACRSSFAILATDGFWNGDDPVGHADPATPPELLGATATNGPINKVPSGDTTTQYLANPPYSGPYSATYGAVGVTGTPPVPTNGAVPSLADVATYYWETDLQPSLPNEVAHSTTDPAAWQHMTTFTIGLGFTPVGIQGTNSAGDPATVQDIFNWAVGGGAPISNFSWPTAYSNGVMNISDLAHAALNGHGAFFNVTSPGGLADALNKAFAEIAAITETSPSAAVNASVLSAGAISFSTSYETDKWSGTFQALALNPDGSTGAPEWSSNVNAQFHSAAGYKNRRVWTDAYSPTASPSFSAFQFTSANASSLDAGEKAGIGGPVGCTATGDTLCKRIDYLLGDSTYEGTLYRPRSLGILGAIIGAQPVYVAGATGNYASTWPTGSPEVAAGAQSYDTFVANMATRPGTVYVGANDGMLHAFDAPLPTNCVYSGTPPASTCNYNSDGTAGNERWAFVPRAVYANLGNLTSTSFQFLRTVDATPVTRDVFFSEGGTGNNQWHTILAGGVGLGGRGVYALDITNPTSFSASDVLWEFDSDSSTAGCVSIVGVSQSGSCAASDLGFTVSQPNIGRIAYQNKWVVLVPNGYFPDCTADDIPTADAASCQAIAGQAPGWSTDAPYSALFVLDAQTGAVIAELKTPQISGVKSFGLATPVMGTYSGNQIDTVAFAGDVEGNLWRFDLSATSPTSWTVTLVYQAPVQGAQPITTMPRLFPDPTTNRFMIVFGTGRFLGVGDNGNGTVQAVYGVRDVPGTVWTQSDLTQQYLHEETPSSGPYAGVSLRCITGSASDTSCTKSVTALNSVPASSGGWYFNLQTTTSDGTVNDAGERVVATPAAVFSSNTVIIGTLITGSESTDACSPATQGSILALNALDGGSAGVSALGGGAIAGARVTNAQTSGTLPVASRLGGGQVLPLGLKLAPGGTNPLSIDAPIWRRRSWHEINSN